LAEPLAVTAQCMQMPRDEDYTFKDPVISDYCLNNEKLQVISTTPFQYQGI